MHFADGISVIVIRLRTARSDWPPVITPFHRMSVILCVSECSLPACFALSRTSTVYKEKRRALHTHISRLRELGKNSAETKLYQQYVRVTHMCLLVYVLLRFVRLCSLHCMHTLRARAHTHTHTHTCSYGPLVLTYKAKRNNRRKITNVKRSC